MTTTVSGGAGLLSLALVVLTDRPEEAAWLEPEGRAWLAAEMAREGAARAAHAASWSSLLDPRLLLLCLVYFLNTTVTYGIFLWLPRMVEEALGRRSSVAVMIPFAFALVAGGVLILRYREPHRHRAFRAPGGPIVPVLTILTCLLLMAGLPIMNWLRFFSWLVIGLVIYYFYGRRKSTLRLATSSD